MFYMVLYVFTSLHFMLRGIFGCGCLLFQLYRGGQFYWWRKPEYPDKAPDLPEVCDKLDHIYIMVYRIHIA
jgi:hypothetical protein